MNQQVERIIAVAREECALAGLPTDDTTVMRRLATMLLLIAPAMSAGYLRPFVDWAKVGTAKEPPSL